MKNLPGGTHKHFIASLSLILSTSGGRSGMTSGMSSASIFAGYFTVASSNLLTVIQRWPRSSLTVPVRAVCCRAP